MFRFFWRGAGGFLICEKAIGGRVADNGVWGGGGRWGIWDLFISFDVVSTWYDRSRDKVTDTKKTRHRARVQSWSSSSKGVPASMKNDTKICMRSRRSRTAGSVNSPHHISNWRFRLL